MKANNALTPLTNLNYLPTQQRNLFVSHFSSIIIAIIPTNAYTQGNGYTIN
jgi:hypothetical protein